MFHRLLKPGSFSENKLECGVSLEMIFQIILITYFLPNGDSYSIASVL